MVIVYLETNFLVGFARGQSECPEAVLYHDRSQASLRMPDLCCMEAIKVVLEWERSPEFGFRKAIEDKIKLFTRDSSSPEAKALEASFRQVLLDNDKWIDTTQRRLYEAIGLLSAQNELFSLSSEAWKGHQSEELYQKDPADSLILHSIVQHAHSQPQPKAFLSNDKIFNDPPAKQRLKAAGIEHFSRPEALSEWIKKQNSSGS